MLDKNNEVFFEEYCKTCKYKNYSETDSPCAECIAEPVNLYSHKPVKWEGADGIFSGPPPRPDHAYERAVKYIPEKRKDKEKAFARQNIDAEYAGNKIQSLDGEVTEDQYPSANAVKEALKSQDESTTQALAAKIDAPSGCKCGDFLAVEEVDEDGVVKKVVAKEAETAPPDWNENDPTKPGYVKNRTHYDSRRENVELFNVTVENVTESTLVKLSDVGIDVSKIDRLCVTYEYTETEGGDIDRFEFESTEPAESTDISSDYGLDTGNIIMWIFSNSDGFYLDPVIYFQTSEAADAYTNTTGVFGPGLYIECWYGDIKDTFVAYGAVGKLCTLDPKYIKDMYYTETGYGPVAGYEGWELLTNQSAITISLMEIQGTLHKNVPVSSSGQYVYVDMGGYRITFDRGNRMCYTSSDSITADDIIFYVDYTTIHQIPDEYIPDTLARKEDLIQPNWNITDSSSLGFIHNKPNLSYQFSSITSDDNLSKIGINTYNNVYERCTYFELLSVTSMPSDNTMLQISSGKFSICPLKTAIGCDILIHCTRVGESSNHKHLYYIYIFEHKNINSIDYSGSLVCFKIISIASYASATLVSSDGQTLKCSKVLQYYK